MRTWAAWGLSAVLAVVAALLLAWGRPPFIDLPLHALTLAMLRHPEAYPDVVVQLVPWTTNSLWFVVDGLVLRHLVTPSQSVVLGTWLALVTLPPALALWARAQGRDPTTALLLGWALAWSRPLYWGFLHYALSLPVALAALGLDAASQRDRARWRHGVLAGVLVVAFLLHAQTLAFLLGALAVQRVIGALTLAEPGTRLRHALGWLPAASPAAALEATWIASSLLAPSEDEAPMGNLVSGLGASWTPLLDALNEISLGTQGFIRHAVWDDILAWVLLAAGIAATIGSAVIARRSGDRVELAGSATGAILALAAFILYLVLPRHIEGQFYLSTRMAVWIALATAPALCRPIPAAWQGRRVVAAAVLAVWGTLGQAEALGRHHAVAADLDALMADTPPGQRLMLWAPRRTSPSAPSTPFTHHLAWTAAETLGTVTFSFASFRPNPVVYRDPTTVPHTIAGNEFRAWCTAFSGHATDVDRVVVREGEDADASMCHARQVYGDRLREVRRQGEWVLYAVTAPLDARVVAGCTCTPR